MRVWFEEGGYETFPGEQIELLAPPGAQARQPVDEEPDETESE